MAMIRFNRWLSSSSFSRRFFDGSLGGSGCADSASRSSTSPISRKFFADHFEVFGSLAIGYRNAWQEIIIQCVGRPRQNARLQHPRTAAGAYPVVQADAHDIISIRGGLCCRPVAKDTGYQYT